jgi:hypothetical protein
MRAAVAFFRTESRTSRMVLTVATLAQCHGHYFFCFLCARTSFIESLRGRERRILQSPDFQMRDAQGHPRDLWHGKAPLVGDESCGLSFNCAPIFCVSTQAEAHVDLRWRSRDWAGVAGVSDAIREWRNPLPARLVV